MNNNGKSIAVAESDSHLYDPVAQEAMLEGLSPEEQAETKKMWEGGREVVRFLNEEKRKDNQEVLDLFDSFKEKTSTPSPESSVGASSRASAPTPVSSGYYYGANGSISSSPSYTDNSKFKAEQAAWRAKNRERREAIAAKTAAEKAKEEELLGSGLYFKDGYGKIRMKKKVAEKKFGANLDMQEKTAYEIKKAGENAYARAIQGSGFASAVNLKNQEKVAKGRQKTAEIVQSNKRELAMRDAKNKELAISKAKGNLAIFDGLVAAFNALGEDIETQKKRSREIITGGVLYDKNQRAIGAGGVKKDHMASMQENLGEGGNAPKWGYVGVETIEQINARLKDTGNKHIAITGIIARQDSDATGNKQSPTFYVQGVRSDGTKFGREMTLADVYSLGKKNYMDTGWSEMDSYNEVSGIFGDVIGEGKRIAKDAQKTAQKLSAEDQMKMRKGEFDMRNSHLTNLVNQRKALLEQEGVDNSKAIAAIDKEIATVNSMNSASLGVTEFARALGITGLGSNSNPNGYEEISSLEAKDGKVFDPNETVESDGKTLKRVQFNSDTGEYTVNTKHEQADGTYSFRISKDKAHLGEKWVTYVDADGKVKRRKREENDGRTEQHDNGLYLKGKKADGKEVEIFVPAGKVIKTAFGVKKVSGEKGNYTLVDTNEKPNWTAYEGVSASWANRDTEKQRKTEEQRNKKSDALYEEADKADFEEKHPILHEMSDPNLTDSGLPAMLGFAKPNSLTPSKGIGTAAQGREKYAPKRSRANWGARRTGTMTVVSNANEMIDKEVAKRLGISVEEARKMREEKESKKK